MTPQLVRDLWAKAQKEGRPLVVLICGSRTLLNKDPIWDFLDKFPNPLRVVEGGASGADRIAEEYCLANVTANDLTHKQYLANWNKHGRSAGPIRNQQMLDEEKPDVVGAFYDGKKTPGTSHMVKISREAGVYVYEEIVPWEI